MEGPQGGRCFKYGPLPGRCSARRPPLIFTPELRGAPGGQDRPSDGSDGRRLPRSPPINGRRACLTLTTVDQEEAAKQASLDQDSFQALNLLPMLC